MGMASFSKNTKAASEIAKRYEAQFGKQDGYERINLIMDLTAADGVNDNSPLDWEKFVNADNFNFMHDIGGICKHMNRANGRLENCFVPRCAR
jgi:hypothetical protein